MAFLLTSMGASPAFASSDQYINIVNPIRGGDFFTLSGSRPVDNVNNEWNEIKKRNLNATWLVRPDGLNDPQITNLLKTFSPNQELGLLMEVTPTWTKMARVNYRQSASWHSAGSIFLTGYSVEERQKLIDTAFERFKSTFGAYPKSVGAWWIDGGSLSYMKDKYGVVTNMDVADQYSTDNYQVWGQFFSTPFYPAKRNALVPASGGEQKIGVVTIQWAARDPFNSYGNGVSDSTYSVQANDYANPKFHTLDINYFKKLMSIYLDNPYSSMKQVTIGLENDFSWQDFGGEYARQLDVALNYKKSGANILTMNRFGNIYQSLFPVTPPQIILADDPLGSGGKVLWYQNLNYRVGWFSNQTGSVIRDLRLFRESVDEPCLQKSCDNLNLARTENENLDEVTYGDNWIIDEGKVSDIKVLPITDGVQVSYKNSAGAGRTIKFTKNDVIVDNSPLTIQSAIAQAIKTSENIQKIKSNFNYTLKSGLAKTLIDQTKGFLEFLIFIIFLFYLPGLAVLKKTEISSNIKFVLAWPIGLAVFTLLAFVIGTLDIYWILYILPVISLIIIRKEIIFPKIKFTKESLAVFLLIIVGSATWLSTMVKNGLEYDYGLGFWGANGHDAMWHLSLIESLKWGVPPQNPIFAGMSLHNYHYFFDLCLAAVSVMTGLSTNDLYFRFFPIFLSITIGITVYLVASRWFESKMAGLLAVFFIYFGGSFGWLVSFFKDRSFGGESLFWSQQGISTLINPPFAVSVLLFLTGLFLFIKIIYQKQYEISWLVSLVIVWGSLIEFKVYAGLLVLGALAVLTIFELFRKNIQFLKISLPIAILSGMVFIPNNLAGGSLLVFSPFWLVHSMVDSADRLNWMRLSLARTAGLEGKNWFKFFGAEILGLLIFIFGNLGTRMFGMYELKHYWDRYYIFISSFLIFALVIPLLFIQKGGAFNTVQFFYYFLLVFNFLAAGALARLVGKFKIVGWIIVGILVLLTIPTTWNSLTQYLPSRPPARIPAQEVEALNFLKNQSNGTVLSYYFDEKQKLKYEEPIPLFAYASTPYVGAYSGKPEYVADTINLEILGIDYKGRLQTQKDIFAQKEPDQIRKTLKSEKIEYIYAIKNSKFTPDTERFGLQKIFGNDEVTIYRVN